MAGQTPGDDLTPAEAKDRFRRAMEGNPVVNWIQENPWTAVSIALGVGVVLGRSRRVRAALYDGVARLARGDFLPALLAMCCARGGGEAEEEAPQEQPPG